MRKLILTVAGLALVASPAFAGKFNKVVSVGDKAPTFSGIPATDNGQDASLTLSDIKEPVVVVVFVNKECPAVLAVEDRIIDFTSEFKDKGVKVVGISVVPNDDLSGIKSYTKDKKTNYVYGYDESQAIGKAYGATNTPQFFVLDKDRVIRYTGSFDDATFKADKASKHYLSDAVTALLKGEKISESETKAVGCGIHYKK
ncbi:redoxin family protein [Singulisphaera rosea]